MTFVAIAVGAGVVVGAGVSLYEGSKQGAIANSELGIQGAQLGMQEQSFNQLQQLMANPASFFSSPTYTAAANQGTQAVARANAASGGPNSGQEAQALQAYGQSFGQQQFLSQEQLLAGMSGTGFNPASAGSVASSATTAQGNALGSLGGLLAFFGTSGGGSGGGGGGGTANYGAWSSGGTVNFDGSGGTGISTDVLQ